MALTLAERFRGTDAAGNTQLWFTDGTVTGTQALTAFTASAAASWPSDITALPDRAVFFAADTGGIMQLWSTDGTAAGTMMLSAVQDPAGLGLTAGMIACAALVPLAMICCAVRSLPFYWRLIDCSFGAFGIVPLIPCQRLGRRVPCMAASQTRST